VTAEQGNPTPCSILKQKGRKVNMLDLLVLISVLCDNKIILTIALIFLTALLIQKIRKLIRLQKGATHGKKR